MAKKMRGAASARVRLRPAPKGREVDPTAHAEVLRLLGDRPRRADLLIEHLHLIQDAHGHLSARHLTALAFEMGLATAEVYEVASFYHHFDIVKEGQEAPPRLTIRVCESISCHLADARSLLRRLEDLRIEGVRVIPAPCAGRCDRAPVAIVGRNPVDHATPDTVMQTVGRRDIEPPMPDGIAHHEYRKAGGYAILAEMVAGSRTGEDVLQELESSGLRGLGGAGFPMFRKVQFVLQQPGPRLVVVNADEGEPGTFKDRHILETDPHRMLEGMLIAARLVDAADCYIYLRDEYPAARALLERELAALVADPPCALPRIHLRRGAGAYICGEESSLIESLEGKRGEPRLRPPFPAQFGAFGRPTLMNNVETLFWLRDILEHGGEAFAARGTAGRKGVRYFSVSGRVRNPGVHLAPNGVTARQLIDDHAGGMLPGHTLYGFLPGGASGGILPASLADEPLDFEVLAKHGSFIGSAAIVVLSDHDRAMDAAHNLMRFFAHESCGKCTPCRAGTAKSEQLMALPNWDVPLLEELAVCMMDASICGLGQAAPNPMRSVVRFFPQELNHG
ncbi:MAG: NAD(P)H-dependent oxidoreductase subunit E [Gemmatimonadetes bacterium]|nr:NAD(P)H-dependent oxidoreductase subunit E [Gemmatimonadota bacterium]